MKKNSILLQLQFIEIVKNYFTLCFLKILEFISILRFKNFKSNLVLKRTSFQILLLISILKVNANTNVNGFVKDDCSGLPIPGAQVLVQGTQNSSQLAITDQNGFYSASVLCDGNLGSLRVIIIDPPFANPQTYNLQCQTGSGTISNINFNSTPRINGEIFLRNIYGTPGLPFEVPLNNTTPYSLFECNYQGFICGGNLIPLDPVCDLKPYGTKLNLYSYTNPPVLLKSTQWKRWDCRNLDVWPYVKDLLDGMPGNTIYSIEWEIKCWKDVQNAGGVPSNKKSGLIKWIRDLEPGDADFKWIASMSVENINNDPIDGLINRNENFKVGPYLGPLSIGINIGDYSIHSGTISEYTVKLTKFTNCNGGNESVIFEKTYPAPGGTLPTNFLFLDEVMDGSLPYFSVNSNTINNCFKCEVSVKNTSCICCVPQGAFSYFEITEDCQFCLVDKPKGGMSSEMAFANDSEKNNIGKNLSKSSSEELKIYPNPIYRGNKLYIKGDWNSIQLFNASGKFIDIRNENFQQFIELGKDIMDGIYFYIIQDINGKQIIGKLMIIN